MKKLLNIFLGMHAVALLAAGLISCKSEAPSSQGFVGTYQGLVEYTVGFTSPGVVKVGDALVTIQRSNGKYSITFSDYINPITEIEMKEVGNRLEAVIGEDSMYKEGTITRNADGSISFSFASKDFKTWKGTNCVRVER